MKWKTVMFIAVMILSSLSGCYTEPGQGVSLEVDGHPMVSEEGFTMDGQLRLSGGIPSQESYQAIRIELNAQNGSLMYKENLGTLHNQSDRLKVSISLSTVPYYVIFDSPDIWDGETGVPYYVRSETGYQGYQIHVIGDRKELPITPDG